MLHKVREDVGSIWEVEVRHIIEMLSETAGATLSQVSKQQKSEYDSGNRPVSRKVL